MNNIDPVQIVRPYISTFIVPGFIYQAATKANLNLMDLTVYSKIRQVCSQEDMAAYAYLQDNAQVRGTKISSLPLCILMNRAGANEAEFNLTLDRMSRTEEIKQIVESYLSEPAGEYRHLMNLERPAGVAQVIPNKNFTTVLGNAQNSQSDLPYQLKTDGGNVFIIAGPGFSKYVGTSGTDSTGQAFVRDFIRHCDGLFGPVEVAQHPLFVNFLNFLAA